MVQPAFNKYKIHVQLNVDVFLRHFTYSHPYRIFITILIQAQEKRNIETIHSWIGHKPR